MRVGPPRLVAIATAGRPPGGDGQFAGDSAVEEITGPTVNLADCLHPPGITNHTSVVALQITRTT